MARLPYDVNGDFEAIMTRRPLSKLQVSLPSALDRWMPQLTPMSAAAMWVALDSSLADASDPEL